MNRTRTRTRIRPLASYRPFVERLEDRLPPGDAVLGALLAWRAAGLVPSVWDTPSTQAIDTRRGQAPPLAQAAFLDGPAAFALLPEHTELVTPSRAESLQAADKPFTQTPANRRLPLLRPDDAGSTSPGAVPSASFALGSPGDFRGTVFVTPPPVNYQLDQAVAALLPPTGDDGGAGIQSSGVHALFNLDHPNNGPFPSNIFTVPDRTQNTNLRINLPFPDCKVYVSDCEDLAVLNELDGFNLQPRLSVPFSGPIDVTTVTSETIFLISLGSTVSGQGYMPRGIVVGINQVVWDVETNALHVESDELLAQHTRFALIVTNGIRDADGDRVEASPEFRSFRETAPPAYRRELEDAIRTAQRLGISERQMVTASVFTTQSATAILEKIRDQIHAGTPKPADFLLGPKGEQTVFNLDDVKGIRWDQQLRENEFNPFDLNLQLLQDIYPDAVGQLAFGKYHSPDYEVHPGEYIPRVGTRAGTPAVQGENVIYFNLVLPSGPMPKGGWPVAIFGHGGGANKNETMTFVAASMANQGVATIITNSVGHGFGPLGTLTVNQTDGQSVTFPSGGRAIDQNGDRTFGPQEGFTALRPWTLITGRDGIRQTAIDFMQLVRVIEVGMDVGGDGASDLDPSRVYYFGWSQGGNFGSPFLAVEPNVRAGVVINPGHGYIGKAGRIAPMNRPGRGNELAARIPSLINPPGVISIDGVAINAPRFHENFPLRNGISFQVRLADGTDEIIQAPVINTVTGAMAIQGYFDHNQWAAQAGNPVAYAPHLRKAPLAGVSAKSVIVQFGKADQTAANPSVTAVIRAGDLADRATFYRHDLAYDEDTRLPKNSHRYVMATDTAAFQEIALGAQGQIATFFASDGKTIIHPEPKRFFEVPIQGPLPEDLNYIP